MSYIKGILHDIGLDPILSNIMLRNLDFVSEVRKPFSLLVLKDDTERE